MGKQRTSNIIQTNTLPALRFAGNPGVTTSRDRGSGLLPALWPRASPAAQGSTPRSQPEGSQDTRDGNRSRVQRPCPQRRRGKLHTVRFHESVKARSLCCPSSPNRTRCAGLRLGAGMRQGAVTPRCIVLTRSQLQKWRQPRAGRCALSSERRSRNGFTGVPPAGKGPLSSENGRKRSPAPTGVLCATEQI